MLDCLVIGGGHSGLMCGHLLARAGLSYRVVDALARPGDVWRQRPLHLRLFTSKQFCRLADMPMPGRPGDYPTGMEFADHVERFARAKAIAATYGVSVTRLWRDGKGFAAQLSDGQTLLAKTVINATGSNQQPVVPEFAQRLDASVVQLTAASYRDATDVPSGMTVALVGDGVSGRQIAQELAPGHRVHLACGRHRTLVPNQLLGRDLFWWLDKLGLLYAGRDTLVAKIMRRRDPIPVAAANDARLRGLGVTLHPRAVEAEGGVLIFGDGHRQAVDAVIWCGGYRENLDWLDLPGIDGEGALLRGEGRTPEAGFYVMGRKWLSCRASELVPGVERDASRVVGYVCRQIQTAGQPVRTTEELSNA